MFGMMRRKTTDLTVTGPVKLSRKEKKKEELRLSKLQREKSNLEYDIKAIGNDITQKTREAEEIDNILQYTQADLDKIRFCVGEKRFATCADIAREHRWHNAVQHFEYASDNDWNKSEWADASSRGVYQVEVHLRNEEKKYKRLENEVGKLTNKQAQKQKALQKLLNSSFS